MGSVPNCRKEIADRYPIRWFKCKLKPPKKENFGKEIGNTTTGTTLYNMTNNTVTTTKEGDSTTTQHSEPQPNSDNGSTMSKTKVLLGKEILEDGEITNEKVAKMFDMLISHMVEIKTDLQVEIQQERTDKERRIVQLEQNQIKGDNEVKKVKDANSFLMTKIDKLADTVARQDQVISELHNKIEIMEKEKLKPNLLIKGIQEEQDENCVELVQNFFKEKMEIDEIVGIRKAFRIGKGKNQAILATLLDSAFKVKIFSSVNKLQGKKNHLKRAYHIDDQLPARLNTTKQKQHDIMWRNKNTVANQLVMSLKKGKLITENKEYESKIIKPEGNRLVKLKPDEVAELQSPPVSKVEPVKIGTSIFQDCNGCKYI